jgi:hypothetical protein
MELFTEAELAAIEKDFKASKGTGFKNLEDGIYPATILDVELTRSKKGNPMFVVTTQLQAINKTQKVFIVESKNTSVVDRFKAVAMELGDTTSESLADTYEYLEGLHCDVVIDKGFASIKASKMMSM